MTTTSGTITAIIAEKFFGFIRVVGQGKDTFSHGSELHPDLEFNESLIERRVEFESIDTSRGPKAVNIRAAA
jgi:cold shock CspA family protein